MSFNEVSRVQNGLHLQKLIVSSFDEKGGDQGTSQALFFSFYFKCSSI